jgi:hypothetical protein
MNERPKTPYDLVNEILLKENPRERLKKLEEENPSISGLITREIDLTKRSK